jgi:hypothetical protein
MIQHELKKLSKLSKHERFILILGALIIWIATYGPQELEEFFLRAQQMLLIYFCNTVPI